MSKKLTVLITTLLPAVFLIPFVASCDVGKSVRALSSDCETLGHSYVGVVTAPKCTERGYTTYTCSRCNNSYVGDYKDALGHDLKKETTITCAGATDHTYCTREGCTYEYYNEYDSDVYVAHDWSDWTTVSTADCYTDGSMTRECYICHTVETQVIKAYDHTTENSIYKYDALTYVGESDGCGIYVCSICGEYVYLDASVADIVVEEDDVCEHNWGSKWYSAEYTYNGMVFPVRYKVCKKCGEFGCFETVSGNSSSLPWYVILIIVLLAIVVIALLVYIVYKNTNRRKNTD